MTATTKPIVFWAGTHPIRSLTQDDIPQVQELFERCQEFWWISEERPVPADAARSNFTDAPPNYDPSRLIFLGVYSPTGRLIGFLSTPPGYPAEGDWYIGLMVLDPDVRGRGLGETVYRAFETWVARQGGRRVLISVVDDNPRGRTFWQRMGFTAVRSVPPRVHGEKTQGMLEMERRISASRDGD